MKKFLAVLLAVAMVMSLIPTMAFAETNSYLRIKEVADETTGKVYSQGNFSTPIAAGETVSFDFRPASTTKEAWEEISVREYNHAHKWFYVEAVYDEENANAFVKHDIKVDPENVIEVDGQEVSVVDPNSIVVTAGADGWYNVSFKVTVAQPSGMFIRFASCTDDATKNYCDIDNLKVGSKTCSFNTTNLVLPAQNDIDLKFDDDTAFDYVQKSNGYDFTAEILSEDVTPGEDNTEDTEDVTENVEKTEDVEKTGVVSVAVVAVAAVVGGAVVLKKREF